MTKEPRRLSAEAVLRAVALAVVSHEHEPALAQPAPHRCEREEHLLGRDRGED